MTNAKRVQLWAEMLSFYVFAPLIFTWLLNTNKLSRSEMPIAFFALFIFAIVLLTITPDFKWRSLLPTSLQLEWRALSIFLLISSGTMYLLIQVINPEQLFSFPRRAPEIYLVVMALYPLLSVIPQGIIYRVLFFKRYAALFPEIRYSLPAAAIAFALAHLFFQNVIALLLTFFGGLAFAWAHRIRGSFWTGNFLHIIGGWCIWTFGLGRYFYHGAI